MAPWADVLYGCDFAWWDKHKGVQGFKGLRISQDQKCAAKFPGIRRVICDRQTDALLMSKFGTIGWGGNSGLHVINLAAQFGVSKLILVGYDLRLDLGDHWHGKHVKGLNNPSAKNVERWCRAIDNAAEVLKALEIVVLNTSPISRLMNYPKVTLQEALECAA